MSDCWEFKYMRTTVSYRNKRIQKVKTVISNVSIFLKG